MRWGEEVVNRWSTEHIWGSESTAYYNSGCKITADGDCSHKIKRHLLLGKKAMTTLDRVQELVVDREAWRCKELDTTEWLNSTEQRQYIKKQRQNFADKSPFSQSYGFSSSYVWTWELDHKEGWVPKNWCFWTVVLENTLKSTLNSKEVKPVNPKGNQPWIFIGRTDPEAEGPILWPPDVNNQVIGKDADAQAGGEEGDRG